MSLRSVAHQLLDSPFDGNLYGRENGAWVTVPSSSGGMAEAPTDGQLYGRRGSSASWLPVMAVASGVPASPANNQLWWDTTDGNLYLWFNDGTSTQWVPAVATAAAAGGPYLPTSGGVLTGALTLAGNATANLQPVTLQQLNAVAATASKQYVISVVDQGAKGDGATDDTTAIQNTLNTYAGKAIVYIPVSGGNYRTMGLTLPSNTELWLDGTLQALPGLTAGYLTASNASNITIRGYGTIDANGPAQTAVGGMAGLAISACTNVRVSNILITNAFHWNINITHSSNVVFNGVTLTKGGNANEFAAGCDDCWLTNCTIDGTNNGDYGFCFYGNVTNSGAIGNLIHNAGTGTTASPPGIGILSDGTSPASTVPPCKGITIAGNIIHDCNGPGISSHLASTPAGLHSNIIIANNCCYNNCQVGTPASGNLADCKISQSTGVTITGNQFSANGNASAGTFAGIYLDASSDHISVTGNQIYNTGQGTTAGSGIWTNANYVNASGNYIYDNQSTPTMRYSVTGGGGTHNAWVGNYSDLPTNFGNNPDTVNANAINGVWTVGDIGGSTDHIMAIIGCSGHRAGVQYQAIGQPRWLVGTDGVADSGGGTNAGSNYAIAPYTDANALQSPVFTIARNTGLVSATTALAVTQGAANPLATNNWNVAGMYMGWNYTAGGGEGDFITSHGSGGGGFRFYNVATSPSATPVLLASIDNLGDLSIAKSYQVNGVQVVGQPIVGYGTPTGGVKIASFPGASATLTQTSGVLAQLILDLKTHGLLAA